MTNHMHVKGYFPKPYEGKVEINGEELSVVEIATSRELPPILKRFGDWVITPEGIDCLTQSYFIEKGRFDEDDWRRHMNQKVWGNMDDFTAALRTGQDFVRLGII